MAIKTVTGKKFILVARPGISNNPSFFPQKVANISGHGNNSGKEFSLNVKINAGMQKANINGHTFNADGTLLAPPPGPPPPPVDPPVYQNPNTTTSTTQQQDTGGTCFVGGTRIQVPNGIEYIENIEVGDIVKSFDVGTSSVVNSKVTETYVHSDRYYMIINGIIKTTSVHPFYSDGKWIEAGDLSIGDKILHVDGLVHTIKTIELSDTQVTVYNFEVDGTHNYFAEGYLVHNKEWTDPPEW
jgi:hypothetical protein